MNEKPYCDLEFGNLAYRLARGIRGDTVLREISGRDQIRRWIAGYYRNPLYQTTRPTN